MKAKKPEQASGLSDERLARFPAVEAALRKAVHSWETNPDKGGKDMVQESETLAEVVQLRLPYFSEALAIPNAFLRSALFPALDLKKSRPLLHKEQLCTVGTLEVRFSGERFDQGDLDVLSGILDISTRSDVGNVFRFSAYSLLKSLGKQTDGRRYKWLRDSIDRLFAGSVWVRDKRTKRRFFGHLIEGGIEDESTMTYAVRVNPELGVLFGFDAWSRVNRVQRRALRNATAKALHAYYSSHTRPSGHRYETLGEVVGCENKQAAGLKRRLIKAHDDLVRCGFLESYDAQPALITAHIAQEGRRTRARKRRVSNKNQ